MRTACVVFCGDSITYGHNYGVGAGQDYPALVGAQMSTIVVQNTAVGGASCDSASQGASADALIDGTKDLNICCVLFGANDGLTKSAATFESDLSTWVAARLTAGFNYVVVLTMLPCGSYDSVAFRAAVNADARTRYTYVVDLGSTTTTMGAEAAKNDSALYSDTVHPTVYGHTLLEPPVTAKLSALLSTASFSSVFAGVVR